MKGIQYREHGPLEQVLECVDLPEPACGPGQVRVQVLASPIDPADILAIRGLYAIQPPLPACPGMEGCGRVLESRFDGLSEGDLVVVPMRSGAWCEQVAVDGAGCVRVPEGDPVQMSMLRINPCTAHRLLDGVEPGQWVVQDPGSCGVGQLVIQEARRRGIHTVSVVRRSSRVEFLKSLGGDRVVEKTGRGLPRCVRALDGTGGVATERLARCLEKGGEVVCYGAVSRQPAQLSVAQTVFRGVTMRGFWLYQDNLDRPSEAAALLQRCAHQLASGELHQQIAGTFSLDDWGAAVALVQSPERNGKVVFVP